MTSRLLRLMTWRIAPALLPAWFAMFVCAVAMARDGGTCKPFDIPNGEAEQTLQLFARQSGAEFVFSASKVKGVRTHAVKGAFQPGEALDRMLSGTGLHSVQDKPTGALTVDRDRPPVSQADGATAQKKSTPW